MALQHFYTYVPTKLSMFNRMDSYDTFACSEGITYDYIEKNLATVINYKSGKNEANLIRDGKLPSLYCQYVNKAGDLVQSCTSFFQKDYTGEKSAYFVHTLVYSNEETEKIIDIRDNNILNKDMFKNDLSWIDLTSPELSADRNYPEIEYSESKIENVQKVIEKYDRGMVKRVLFAIINAICGKGKDVYILLPGGLANQSVRALEFINAIIDILPKGLKTSVSFATYLGEPAKYPFKVKFISSFSEASTERGVVCDFDMKQIVGFTDDNLAPYAQMIEFFYSLFANEKLRNDFHTFMNRTAEKNEGLATANIKSLNDLVNLFMESSGNYGEYTILPNDDAVLQYLTTYEKYRSSMDEVYCAKSLKCIERYSKKKIAIPKNIFQKVGRIYPKECFISKRTVLDVVLDLIHTDLMRDKLFAFIKANYDDEDPEVKERINSHLCSVYYGGFLQSQLLEFFTSHFQTEPENVQNLIIEKMALTVRNTQVQDGVMNFFDVNYEFLNGEQKKSYFDMLLEQLRDCDDISEKFVVVINKDLVIEQENNNDEFVSDIKEKICIAVENDLKRKNPLLLGFIIKNGGICNEIIAAQMMENWSTRKIFKDYISIIVKLPLKERVATIIKLHGFCNGNDEIIERLADEFELNEGEQQKESLSDVMEAEKLLSANIKTFNNQKFKNFIKKFTEENINGTLLSSIGQVFDIKQNPTLIDDFRAFAEDNDALTEAEEYAPVKKWFDALDSLKEYDCTGLLSYIAEYGNRRSFLYTKTKELANEYLSGLTLEDEKGSIRFAILVFIYQDIEKNKFRFRDTYKYFCDKLGKKPQNETDDLVCLDYIIKALAIIENAKCFEDVEKVVAIDGELSQVLKDYLALYPKQGKNLLKQKETCSDYSQSEIAVITDTIKKSGGNGLFAKLFKK